MIIIIIMKKKNFWAKIVFGLLPNYIVKKKNLCCKARFVLQLKGA